jgi:hypothetical protein
MSRFSSCRLGVDELSIGICSGESREVYLRPSSSISRWAQIPSLLFLEYRSGTQAADEDEEILTLFALSFHALRRVLLVSRFASSASLLKIIDCCRDLKIISFGDKEIS